MKCSVNATSYLCLSNHAGGKCYNIYFLHAALYKFLCHVLQAAFGEIVSTKASQRKKKEKLDFTGHEDTKDKENFIHYRPSDFASEKGFVYINLYIYIFISWVCSLFFF